MDEKRVLEIALKAAEARCLELMATGKYLACKAEKAESECDKLAHDLGKMLTRAEAAEAKLADAKDLCGEGPNLLIGRGFLAAIRRDLAAFRAESMLWRDISKQDDALKVDAMRYRWLRKLDWEIKRIYPLCVVINQDDDPDEPTNSHVLDAAIDAAMKEGK